MVLTDNAGCLVKLFLSAAVLISVSGKITNTAEQQQSNPYQDEDVISRLNIPLWPLSPVSFKAKVCSAWSLLGIMRSRQSKTYYDGTPGHPVSLESAALTIYFFLNTIPGVSNFDSTRDWAHKAFLVVHGKKETESISSTKLFNKIIILGLTQSFVGEIIIKCFAIPQVLRYYGVSLENEYNESRPILIVNNIPLITMHNLIHYSYKTLQYVVWVQFIRWRKSDPDLSGFLLTMLGSIIYHVATNVVDHLIRPFLPLNHRKEVANGLLRESILSLSLFILKNQYL